MSSIEIQYNNAVNAHLKNKSELFTRGTTEYKTIDIPNFSNQMTSLEMKELYVTKGTIQNELTPLQLGALYQYINEKTQKEHISYIFDMTEKVQFLFSQQGSVNTRLIPQDFYLSLVGDKFSGRCYPLVRVMAVALASQGNVGANKFIDNLFLAASYPDTDNTILLRNSLANLHSNTDAVYASISQGQLNLKKIRILFYSNTEDSMYALNTQKHSMLLGKKTINNEEKYYFYVQTLDCFVLIINIIYSRHYMNF